MNDRQGPSRNPAIALAALAAMGLWVGCSDDPMRAPDTDVLSPPKTATGTRLPVVVPLPSWPSPLVPQQYAAPPVVRPQMWNVETLIDAKVIPAATRVGVLLVVIPPIWPVRR